MSSEERDGARELAHPSSAEDRGRPDPETPSDGPGLAGAAGPPAIDRREALKWLGTGAVGAAGGVPSPLLERFLRALGQEGDYDFRFFGEAELETVRVLADMIIPRDERSGSATDAGTVEYMDFVLGESEPATQEQWRKGLAWLDAECRERHGVARFADATAGARAQILNLIAWPQGADPRYREQVEWFNRVRDLVGSGFFSSRMGVEDLDYRGGVFAPVWWGVPPEVLEQLGLSYEEWDSRYGAPG